MLFLLLLLLLNLTHTDYAATALPYDHKPDKIFLLAGQSNMAGRGGVTNNSITHNMSWDGVIPPLCASNPSILRLSSNLTWVEAHEPIHADIDIYKTNGIGPGIPFANTLLVKGTVGSAGSKIGLVPCAVGGTNISQWKQGSLLYDQLLKRAKWSVRSGGTIQALLWFQGESDTVDLKDVESYEAHLKKFFFDLRSDLQAPPLPIIQVGLASGEGPYTEMVRKAQLEMDLVNLRTVDAKGLPLEPDGLHLTTEAQVKLGRMMANAFSQLPLQAHISMTNDSRSSCNNFWQVLLVPTPIFLIVILLSLN